MNSICCIFRTQTGEQSVPNLTETKLSGMYQPKMAAASQTTDNAIANPTEAESISILHFKCVSYFKYINISAPMSANNKNKHSTMHETRSEKKKPCCPQMESYHGTLGQQPNPWWAPRFYRSKQMNVHSACWRAHGLLSCRPFY